MVYERINVLRRARTSLGKFVCGRGS